MEFIAIIDDDASVRSSTIDLLDSLGFACEAYPSAEQYLGSKHVADASCLILDINMPGLNGLGLQKRLKELGYSTPVIFITAFPEEATRKQAIKSGAVCYLAKPYGDEALINCILAALAREESEPCRPT
jgi:FixJ family two-component response regulator